MNHYGIMGWEKGAGQHQVLSAPFGAYLDTVAAGATILVCCLYPIGTSLAGTENRINCAILPLVIGKITSRRKQHLAALANQGIPAQVNEHR